MSEQPISPQGGIAQANPCKEFAEDANMVHIDDAAEQLGISSRTIRRMIKQHEDDLRSKHVEEVVQLTVKKLMVSLADLRRLRGSSRKAAKTAD